MFWNAVDSILPQEWAVSVLKQKTKQFARTLPDLQASTPLVAVKHVTALSPVAAYLCPEVIFHHSEAISPCLEGASSCSGCVYKEASRGFQNPHWEHSL